MISGAPKRLRGIFDFVEGPEDKNLPAWGTMAQVLLLVVGAVAVTFVVDKVLPK